MVVDGDRITAIGRRDRVNVPADADWGVPMDSLLKRLVIGWREGTVVEVLFSNLIGPETRVHYWRTGGEKPALRKPL